MVKASRLPFQVVAEAPGLSSCPHAFTTGRLPLSDDNAWVTVASTYFLAEADVIRSVLAEHDIEVFLKGEHTAGLASPLSFLDRGVRIQVRREDESRALELIQSFEISDEPTDVPYDETPPAEEFQTPSWNPRALWVVITGAALAWIVLRVVLSNHM